MSAAKSQSVLDTQTIVFDPGHNSLRVGFGKQDRPEAELPSAVAMWEESPSATLDLEARMSNCITRSGNYTRRYFLENLDLYIMQTKVEIEQYMKNGMVDNWDIFEEALEYTYAHVLKVTPNKHPVVFTESVWNERKHREKLTEVMFEKFMVPEFFLAKNAVLALYANGRATGLVVDSGATHTTVVPVQEGYILTAGVMRSELGGDFLSAQCLNYLEKEKIELAPNQNLARTGEFPNYMLSTLPAHVTQSGSNYMLRTVMEKLKREIIQVLDKPYNEGVTPPTSDVSYTFPSGYCRQFGPERFKFGESLFDAKAFGVGKLALASIGMCDADVRSQLFGAVCVTGGNTQIEGYPERLGIEMQARTPANARLKLLYATGSEQRRMSAWIGGSIVASISSLRRMFITTARYEECGKGLVERNCP